MIDVEGGQVADFFAENLKNPDEFLSPGVTIDCNESLRLKVGDIIYSNLYRPMFCILYDDVGNMTCCIHAVGRRCMTFFMAMGRDTQTALKT